MGQVVDRAADDLEIDTNLEELRNRQFPSNDGETIQLPDGRLLGFAEYVHPDDKKGREKLHVILLFPGLPGTRLFTHPGVQKHEFRGFRLFVLERPGLGLSSPKLNFRIVDWARDVEQFLRQKKIERPFSIIGYSAGGPFALSVAFSLGHLIHKVAIVSSVSPHEAAHCFDGMPMIFKIAWFSTAHFPSLIRMIVARDAGRSPEQILNDHRTNTQMFPECDRNLALSRDIELMFCESEMELISRNQTASMAHEYELWGLDWGFPLDKIDCSVRIWQGAQDISTTLPMGTYLAQSIGCPIMISQDHGHFLYFDAFPEILEWLIDGRTEE